MINSLAIDDYVTYYSEWWRVDAGHLGIIGVNVIQACQFIAEFSCHSANIVPFPVSYSYRYRERKTKQKSAGQTDHQHKCMINI